MSDNNNSTVGGMGFASLLTILFIALKLTGYINWSWWWVLSPLWISAGIFVLIIAVCIGFALLTAFLESK